MELQDFSICSKMGGSESSWMNFRDKVKVIENLKP